MLMTHRLPVSELFPNRQSSGSKTKVGFPPCFRSSRVSASAPNFRSGESPPRRLRSRRCASKASYPLVSRLRSKVSGLNYGYRVLTPFVHPNPRQPTGWLFLCADRILTTARIFFHRSSLVGGKVCISSQLFPLGVGLRKRLGRTRKLVNKNEELNFPAPSIRIFASNITLDAMTLLRFGSQESRRNRT